MGDKWEFAAGAITGLRVWNVDREGRLLSLNYGAIWTPGENVSLCGKKAGPTYTWSLTGEKIKQLPEHHFHPECACGFWAHNEGHDFYKGPIFGAIEGYGKVLVGPAGFRAEKARIIALTFDGIDSDPVSPSRQERVRQLYPDVKFYDTRDELIAAHPVPPRWEDPNAGGFWDNPLAKKIEENQKDLAVAKSLAPHGGSVAVDGGGGGGYFRPDIPMSVRPGDTVNLIWPSGLTATSTVIDPKAPAATPQKRKRRWFGKKAA